MANFVKQHNFTGLTDIVAAEMNTNFNDIANFINNELVHRDGSKDFRSVPTGPNADPTTDNHLARKAYVDARDVAHRNEVNAAVAAAVANANTRLLASQVKWGSTTASTNPAGDIVITHDLGVNPSSVILTPLNGGTSMGWSPAVENKDASTLNVRIFDNDGVGVLASVGDFTLFWVVFA